MWAIAVYDLRLDDEAFWRLTPRQFAALVDRHLLAEERSDRRAALITWAIAETNRNPEKRRQPFKVDDFLVHRRDGDDAQRNGHSQSPEEQAAILSTLAARFGGRG